jgi:hypothetical protein
MPNSVQNIIIASITFCEKSYKLSKTMTLQIGQCRPWKYHLFFDIISYHIICQKIDIVYIISLAYARLYSIVCLFVFTRSSGTRDRIFAKIIPTPTLHVILILADTITRLYSKVWPMLSIFDSNKQKTLLEISVVFDRWGAVL